MSKYKNELDHNYQTFAKQEGTMSLCIVPVHSLDTIDQVKKWAIIKWCHDMDKGMDEGYTPGCCCCNKEVRHGNVAAWVIIGEERNTGMIAVICSNCSALGMDEVLAGIKSSMSEEFNCDVDTLQ